MAGKKEPGIPWRHTTVLVRADLFERARETGVDISDACNQALAEMLGIDYRQQQLDNVQVPPPVIIAKDGGLPEPAVPSPASTLPPRPPVINADDPAAAGTIARNRKIVVKKPVPDISPQKAGRPAEQAPDLPVPGPEKKARKNPLKKAEKSDGLKKFIASKIIRDDTDDAVIDKEELYRIFSRWCREQKISPVPEAKAVAAALKTRFAFREKIVGGSPCWVTLRLR
jgi:hypothetical protein